MIHLKYYWYYRKQQQTVSAGIRTLRDKKKWALGVEFEERGCVTAMAIGPTATL